jgi:hypothetical protein
MTIHDLRELDIAERLQKCEYALRGIADIDLDEMNFDDVVVLRLTIKISVALARRALGRHDLD